MVLAIPYESDGFPAGSLAPSAPNLPVTWDDVLGAAVTVGRPNRQYVFQHGQASMYEALFRWSLVRMALEQSGPWGRRLQRTSAAKTLDPTEKGAVNYFLGMTFCKLFAEKLLNTPWLLHLDVFRPTLNAVLTRRSRPDLVGQEFGFGQWHAFECKGRISPPGEAVKKKAKAQAQRLVSINGTPCTLHVGAVTYLKGESLRFYWRDPPPEDEGGLNLQVTDDAWGYYYRPIVELVRAGAPAGHDVGSGVLVDIEAADIRVGLHPRIAKLLYADEWERARQEALEAADAIRRDGFRQDGLRIVAGGSWSVPFLDSGLGEKR